MVRIVGRAAHRPPSSVSTHGRGPRTCTHRGVRFYRDGLDWPMSSAREDVDAALAIAQRAGATLLKPGTQADWGGYSGYFADPDGHVWEVAWNPGFPLAPDGSVQLPR